MASANDNDASIFIEGICSLPNEVLLMIIRLLPANIVQELQNSNIEWIKHAAECSKIADFRECYQIPHKNIEAFLLFRCQYLTELYVDNMTCIVPARLANTIIRCKHLRVLSLRHSGFSLSAIHKLFSNLKNVVVFAWSVESGNEPFEPDPVISAKKWDKLFLDIHSIECFISFMKVFLFIITDLTVLELNFYVLDLPDSKYYSVKDGTMSIEKSVVPHLSKLTVLKVAYPVRTWFKSDLFTTKEKNAILYISLFIKYMLSNRPKEKLWKTYWPNFG